MLLVPENYLSVGDRNAFGGLAGEDMEEMSGCIGRFICDQILGSDVEVIVCVVVGVWSDGGHGAFQGSLGVPARTREDHATGRVGRKHQHVSALDARSLDHRLNLRSYVQSSETAPGHRFEFLERDHGPILTQGAQIAVGCSFESSER